MAGNYIISASIFAADFTRLGDQINQAEQAGVDWIHIDVMDGHFVPNLTMGPFIAEACRQVTKLPLDAHLMVVNPELLLEPFARAGINRFSVHVETCPNLYRTLQHIHELGCKAGVVLNPGSPVSLVLPVLPLVDHVLVMTVNPGYSGQTFLMDMLPKIRETRNELDRLNPSALVQIDGGITTETLPLAIQAGAQVIVAATSIFKHPEGIAAGVNSLRACMPG